MRDQMREREGTHPADLSVATDDRIQLSVLCQLGHVDAVLCEELAISVPSRRPVGVLAVDPLARTDLIHSVGDHLDGQAQAREDGRQRRRLDEGWKDVKRGDVTVVLGLAEGLGVAEDGCERGERYLVE